MQRGLPIGSLVLALFVACGGEAAKAPSTPATPPPPATPSVEAATSTVAPPAPATSASTSASTSPSIETKAPGPALRFAGAFATPESVYWDEANDRYLVSNIHGNPTDLDNNGFISELSPDGTVTKPKWIAGGTNKVTLHAPKGMAIAGDVLYVADITVVRMFDAKSGNPKGEIKLPGATFVNDLTAAKDGKVYASDSGLKGTAGNLQPTGTDAVWVIDHGKAKPLAKGKDLGNPNGLLWTDRGLVVVTGSGEMFRLDAQGKKQDVTKLPKGSLDGVVAIGETFVTSSWEASAVFRGKLGGTFEAVLSDLKAPADIGYDSKRGRLLVPRFMEDAVEVYELK